MNFSLLVSLHSVSALVSLAQSNQPFITFKNIVAYILYIDHTLHLDTLHLFFLSFTCHVRGLLSDVTDSEPGA